MTPPRCFPPTADESLLDQARLRQQALSLQLDALLEAAGLSPAHLDHFMARAARDPRLRAQLDALGEEPPVPAAAPLAGPSAPSLLARNPRALRA